MHPVTSTPRLLVSRNFHHETFSSRHPPYQSPNRNVYSSEAAPFPVSPSSDMSLRSDELDPSHSELELSVSEDSIDQHRTCFADEQSIASHSSLPQTSDDLPAVPELLSAESIYYNYNFKLRRSPPKWRTILQFNPDSLARSSLKHSLVAELTPILCDCEFSADVVSTHPVQHVTQAIHLLQLCGQAQAHELRQRKENEAFLHQTCVELHRSASQLQRSMRELQNRNALIHTEIQQQRKVLSTFKHLLASAGPEAVVPAIRQYIIATYKRLAQQELLMALDTQQTITSKAVASEPQHAAAADVIARMSSAAMYSGLSTVPTDASSSMVLRSSSSEETEIVVYPCPYCQRTFISLGYLHKHCDRRHPLKAKPNVKPRKQFKASQQSTAPSPFNFQQLLGIEAQHKSETERLAARVTELEQLLQTQREEAEAKLKHAKHTIAEYITELKRDQTEHLSTLQQQLRRSERERVEAMHDCAKARAELAEVQLENQSIIQRLRHENQVLHARLDVVDHLSQRHAMRVVLQRMIAYKKRAAFTALKDNAFAEQQRLATAKLSELRTIVQQLQEDLTQERQQKQRLQHKMYEDDMKRQAHLRAVMRPGVDYNSQAVVDAIVREFLSAKANGALDNPLLCQAMHGAAVSIAARVDEAWHARVRGLPNQEQLRWLQCAGQFVNDYNEADVKVLSAYRHRDPRSHFIPPTTTYIDMCRSRVQFVYPVLSAHPQLRSRFAHKPERVLQQMQDVDDRLDAMLARQEATDVHGHDLKHVKRLADKWATAVELIEARHNVVDGEDAFVAAERLITSTAAPHSVPLTEELSLLEGGDEVLRTWDDTDTQLRIEEMRARVHELAKTKAQLNALRAAREAKEQQATWDAFHRAAHTPSPTATAHTSAEVTGTTAIAAAAASPTASTATAAAVSASDMALSRESYDALESESKEQLLQRPEVSVDAPLAITTTTIQSRTDLRRSPTLSTPTPSAGTAQQTLSPSEKTSPGTAKPVRTLYVDTSASPHEGDQSGSDLSIESAMEHQSPTRSPLKSPAHSAAFTLHSPARHFTDASLEHNSTHTVHSAQASPLSQKSAINALSTATHVQTEVTVQQSQGQTADSDVESVISIASVPSAAALTPPRSPHITAADASPVTAAAAATTPLTPTATTSAPVASTTPVVHEGGPPSQEIEAASQAPPSPAGTDQSSASRDETTTEVTAVQPIASTAATAYDSIEAIEPFAVSDVSSEVSADERPIAVTSHQTITSTAVATDIEVRPFSTATAVSPTVASPTPVATAQPIAAAPPATVTVTAVTGVHSQSSEDTFRRSASPQSPQATGGAADTVTAVQSISSERSVSQTSIKPFGSAVAEAESAIKPAGGHSGDEVELESIGSEFSPMAPPKPSAVHRVSPVSLRASVSSTQEQQDDTHSVSSKESEEAATESAPTSQPLPTLPRMSNPFGGLAGLQGSAFDAPAPASMQRSPFTAPVGFTGGLTARTPFAAPSARPFTASPFGASPFASGAARGPIGTQRGPASTAFGGASFSRPVTAINANSRPFGSVSQPQRSQTAPVQTSQPRPFPSSSLSNQRAPINRFGVSSGQTSDISTRNTPSPARGTSSTAEAVAAQTQSHTQSSELEDIEDLDEEFA